MAWCHINTSSCGLLNTTTLFPKRSSHAYITKVFICNNSKKNKFIDNFQKQHESFWWLLFVTSSKKFWSPTKPKYRSFIPFYLIVVISALGISVPSIFCFLKFLLVQVYLRSYTLIGLLLWLYRCWLHRGGLEPSMETLRDRHLTWVNVAPVFIIPAIRC